MRLQTIEMPAGTLMPELKSEKSSSCVENSSYLGFSNDPRLKAAAQQAIEEFGMSFSAYAHLPMVESLEEALRSMFGCEVVATTGIAEAHAATLAAFVMPGDKVIVDSNVDAGLRKAAYALRFTRGITVELGSHGNFEALESKVSKASRVWFVAQGVDPVSGERLSVPALDELMALYPQLHVYVDDSYGVGWFGQNGVGTVYDEMHCKDRLYLSFSMSHAMSAGGAAVVLPSVEDADRLRYSGGFNLMMHQPVAPSILAAACNSAWLMQTEEAEDQRLILMGKIQRFVEACREQGVSLLDWSESPVFRVCDGAAPGSVVTLTSETQDSEIDRMIAAYTLFNDHFELA